MIDPSAVPLALSAVVGIGLALALARYGIDKPAHRALALFVGLHGVLNLIRLARALSPEAWGPMLFGYERYFWLADGLMLFAFVAVFPRPRAWLPRFATRLWPYLALLAVLDLAYLLDPSRLSYAATAPLRPVDALFDLGYAFVPLVLARDAFGRSAGEGWRSVALVSMGIPLYFLHITTGRMLREISYVLGLQAAPPRFAWTVDDSIFLVQLLIFAALVAYVGAQAWRGDPEKRRAARHHVTWLALPVATSVVAEFVLAGTTFWYLAQAIWFLATPAIVAYALLRHQLLGIDVKLRWTISKSTLAATFVAAFFVASEGAQQFFGETLGSTYVGILAAGALVFAIAPLSRLADGVAAKAVPVDAAPEPVGGGREEAYRAAVRMAWSDGVLSREDEDALDHLADELALPRRRATALRREVEAARAGGAPP